ncbi:MAG: penicillin-binding transpeptidase domain-containing protein, partial [Thermomonas sp.]
RRYIGYFAGLVPVDNPRFSMVVAINDPTKGSYYGGIVAGPVFRNVMEGSLRLMDVSPDNLDAWLGAKAAGHAVPVQAVADAGNAAATGALQ